MAVVGISEIIQVNVLEYSQCNKYSINDSYVILLCTCILFIMRIKLSLEIQANLNVSLNIQN